MSEIGYNLRQGQADGLHASSERNWLDLFFPSESMTTASTSIRNTHAPKFRPPPSRRLQLMELRAFGEFYASLALMPLLRRAPRGDGHPVLVLPGLIASDMSTRLLRAYLAGRGYEAHGWGFGRTWA